MSCDAELRLAATRAALSQVPPPHGRAAGAAAAPGPSTTAARGRRRSTGEHLPAEGLHGTCLPCVAATRSPRPAARHACAGRSRARPAARRPGQLKPTSTEQTANEWQVSDGSTAATPATASATSQAQRRELRRRPAAHGRGGASLEHSRVKMAYMAASFGSLRRSPSAIPSRMRCWAAGKLMLYSKPLYLQPSQLPGPRRGKRPAGNKLPARYRRYMCRRMVVPSSLDRISARSQTWLTSHSP